MHNCSQVLSCSSDSLMYLHLQRTQCSLTGGGKKIALRGRGDGTEAHLPNPPLPLLGRRAGRGFWAGAALPAVPGVGGGGPTPTYMAQNDPHVALIILTTHLWGKIFS